MKQKTGLRAQLLFLMHSQVVCTASFFLAAREEVDLCSVSHYWYCMDLWWRQGNLCLSIHWCSRTTLNSQHNCLWAYLSICTEFSGINVIDIVQTPFQPLFSAGFFFITIHQSHLFTFFTHCWTFHYLTSLHNIQQKNSYLVWIHNS